MFYGFVVNKAMDCRSGSEKETEALAARLAGNLEAGDVVCLQGKLGAGKSVFARALIRVLSGKNIDVPSPTFTLVQTYETKKGTVWHFDLYRVEEMEDVYELGWEEAAGSGIALIEWPERLGGLAPADRLDILFAAPGPEERILTFTGHGNWKDRRIL
jgi:tRNA threonylcarbamoyl adenosine modification protein YjeE